MNPNESIPAMITKTGQLLIFFILIYPQYAFGLLPNEVVVVANSSFNEGVVLARRYMHARNVPKENLFQVNLGRAESIGRGDYDNRLVRPLRAFLANHPNGSRVRSLLLLYGMPLKVDAPPQTKPQKEKLALLNQTIIDLRLELSKIMYESGKTEEILNQHLAKARLEKRKLEPAFRRASLDSELMLVLADDYSLDGWQQNPFFLGFKGREEMIDKDKILMVSRLDGPDPDTVVRILADTFAAEEKGLRGKAYFDARWSADDTSRPVGYAFYDDAIHQAARLVKKVRQIPVVLDQKEELFKPNCCPDAALYCGWYSLAKYVPAFKWARGAVGYHIASAECTTLRKAGSQVWCKRMIEEGVAATIGPVEEPYVQAFPLPSLFFPYLVEGKLTLAECYLLSLPHLSWKMVLIGDPLYRPFAAFN